jgi:hypothetical protein
MSIPIPANATVPRSNRPTPANNPPLASHPSAIPVRTIAVAWTASMSTTVRVLAVSKPPRDNGVDPSRLSTP